MNTYAVSDVITLPTQPVGKYTSSVNPRVRIADEFRTSSSFLWRTYSEGWRTEMGLFLYHGSFTLHTRIVCARYLDYDVLFELDYGATSSRLFEKRIDKVTPLVNHLSELLDQGKIDGALDYLYDEVHDRLASGDLELCEALFKNDRIGSLNPQIGVTLLVISNPWRKKLKHRVAFLEKLEKRVEKLWGSKETERTFAALR